MLEGMKYTRGKPFICDGVIIFRPEDVKSIEITHNRAHTWEENYPQVRINVSGVEYRFRFCLTVEEYRNLDNLSEEDKKIELEELKKNYLTMYKKFITKFLYWLNDNIYNQFIEDMGAEIDE